MSCSVRLSGLRLAWWLPLAWLVVVAAVPAASFVEDGRAVGRLYIAGPTPAELPKPGRGETLDPALVARVQAVQELQYHLERMSGARPEVVVTDDPAAITGPAIVLGQLAVKLGAQPTRTTESGEGYRLLTQGERLLIGGQTDQATLCGVYDLLRELGCDWVMPGKLGEVIPRRATVALPTLDRASAPAFLMRNLWYRGYPQPRLPEEGARYAEWQRRHLGGAWRSPMSGAAGHYWDQLAKKHAAEFAADPTMYALRRMPDGTMQRRGPQLESTHPRVIALIVQEIKETYAKNIAAGKWTKETVAAFPIGPADGLGYSMSQEAVQAGSGRMDPIVGELDRTDELVLLGNRVLEQVLPEYPNAYVGCYSYSTHADYPTRYQPHPHYVQIFAPINFSRFHGVLDSASRTQRYYRNVVEQWGRLHRQQGNPLIYRGYNWNLADNYLPFTKVRIWGEELPFYHQQGIIGLNVEATKQWGTLAPSDYIFMRLAWDPSRDWRRELATFCRHAFGAGAAPMEQLYLRLADRQRDAGQEAGSYHAYHLLYSREWLSESQQLVAAATAAATTDEDRTRIRWLGQIQLDGMARWLDFRDAYCRLDFVATKAAYDALHAQWQAAYAENTDLVANEAPAYFKRFLEKFVSEGLKYTSAPYRLVAPLPDELPTVFDPHGVGHRLGLHHPDTPDHTAVLTKTYSTTWDAQGLAAMRDTTCWYRHRFTLTAEQAAQPLGLFLGSVEDEARVWLNGQVIGTSGRGFSVPFVFDLTAHAKAGENLLALQIVRNSKANEIGVGGLFRPGFLFTGPRLEQAAPKPLELRRILPGGELGELEQ
jgi:hypothetical protein